MKKIYNLYILSGVLALLCIATFVVTRWEQEVELIRNSDEIILELPEDTITSVAWEYGSTALSFHKEDAWLYDEDDAFPVDQDKMSELLELFSAFGVSFIIENVTDYSPYGLDVPVCTISLTSAGQDYTVTLGDYSELDEERYVSIGDGNVYLVKNDPLELYDAVLDDMIDHDETPYFDTVSAIQFTGMEEYSIYYEEDSTHTWCTEDVYFTDRDNETLPFDTVHIDDYLNGISTLELTDYISYNATAEELADTGLDNPELTVTVTHSYTEDDETEVTEEYILHISRDPEERENTEEDESVTAYARVGQSQILYQITEYEYEALMAASYNDLRHTEVMTVSFDEITGISLTLEGETYEITIQEDDGERLYFYGEEEVEIDDLKTAILALNASEFHEDMPDGKEEISFTVSLENEQYPEISIGLYRYDGTYCAAVVNGEPVSLVERSLVVAFIEAVNAIVL